MKSPKVVDTAIMAMVTCIVLTFAKIAIADEQEDLAKESQNPIGNIISLPFENNFDFGVGDEDAFVYSLVSSDCFQRKISDILINYLKRLLVYAAFFTSGTTAVAS